MELLLSVERFQGQPPLTPMSQTFGTNGGTIGRLDSNDWVLPDPSRFISSRHAQIIGKGDQFVINDVSTNGTFVNTLDAPVGRGNEVALTTGDRIFIGEYEVSVRVVDQLATQDAAPSVAVPEITSPEPAIPASADDDWFAQPAAGADEFLKPPEPETSTPEPVAASQMPEQEYFTPPSTTPASSNEIPEDWDALLSGVMVGPQLDSAPPPPAPPAAPAKPPPVVAEPATPPQPSPSPAPAQRVIPKPTPPPPTRPRSARTPAKPAAPAPAAVAAPPAPIAPAPATGGADPARQALLQGLRTQNIATAVGTEQLALEVSSAVRLLTEGMMEVLAARTSTKDEFRLSQTRIGPAMNNPLKFSPNADEALHRMFGNDDRGFLRAQEAFQQGLNDVKAHQVALLAGMQAGLNAILKYFSPGNLEKQIGEYASIASKVPGVREAKLWNHYNSLYDRIAKDAESDFQKLFSREFAEAYEEQIRSLISARGTPGES